MTQLGSTKLIKKKKEKEVLSLMISLYCKGNHKDSNGLCETCNELLVYACERWEKCPFTEKKTFCSACKIHCYNDEMRARIKQVMRYSGPRMLFYHPILLIKHLLIK